MTPRPKLRRLLRAALAAVLLAAALPSPRPAAAAGTPLAPTPIRPVRYDLAFTLDFAESRLAATGRVVVRNSGAAPAAVLPFLLHRLLKVTSLRDAAGVEVPRTQTIVAFEDWDVLQVNLVEARPARPLAPGAALELSIAYEGTLAGYAEAMRYVKDRVDPEFTILRSDAYAFPQPGVPSWKANRSAGLPEFDYALSVTVPPTHVAANGGRLVARRETPAGVVYEYADLEPSWRMDLAIARYGVLEDPARGFKVFHFPEDAAGARRVLAAMSEVSALYSGWFGPLPGAAALAVIEVPEGYGSQSDATCILQTRGAFNDPERMTELYHEIAHSWSVPSLDPLPPRYESEGLAMFLQELVREVRDGKAGAIAAQAERCRDSLRRDFAARPGHARVAMADYGTADLTDLSYAKGMIFFALLDRLMGRRELLDVLGAFSREFRVRGATAAEFEAFVRARSRADLSAAFADWVRGSRSSELLAGPEPTGAIFARYGPAAR